MLNPSLPLNLQFSLSLTSKLRFKGPMGLEQVHVVNLPIWDLTYIFKSVHSNA